MSKRRPKHPWTLTGPWYRWSTPGLPAAGRGTKPEIQQYAGFEYAKEFLAEPQRSLIPRTTEDYVHNSVVNPNPPPATGSSSSRPTFGSYLRERTQTRKLYQAIHGYSYLIVVELHCDVAGLPSVRADEVAEAGFVVRRLGAHVDEDAKLEVTDALEQVALAKRQLELLERSPAKRIRGPLLQRQLEQPTLDKRAQLLERRDDAHQLLSELSAAGKLALETQMWTPDEVDPSRGAWLPVVEQTPRRELSGESVFPLYRLSPDPRDDEHSARGRTIYYGVIPTAGREVEAGTLAARFDDRHTYEVRCFVRRKHERPECEGELVWSEATTGYRVAADADPEAGARMPITITVPSFADVQAFVDGMGTGGGGGVRVVSPPDSVINIGGKIDDLKDLGTSGIGQICFLAVLLLFILALFLIMIFLPILVFVLQLFFLLRLKFCIPPAIDLSVDVAAALKAELDVNFGVGVDFDAVLVAAGAISVGESAEDWADALLDTVYAEQEDLLDKLKQQPLHLKLQRILDLGTDFRGSVEPDLAAKLNLAAGSIYPIVTPGSDDRSPRLPGTAPLVYYARVEAPS